MQTRKKGVVKPERRARKPLDYPKYLQKNHALSETILILLKRAQKEINEEGMVSKRTMGSFDLIREQKAKAPVKVKEAIENEIAFAKKLIADGKVEEFLKEKR